MRDLINIMETGRHLGQHIANDGPLGELEAALSLWVQGEATKAIPHLLALRDIANDYRTYFSDNYQGYHPALYRGFACGSPEKALTALQDGLTIRHTKAMESWSTDADSVYEFMFGFENWVLISCPADVFDIFIDLTQFHDDATPFQNMDYQNEVIVMTKPRSFYPPEMISMPEPGR